ncbi:hypothetical protein DFH01_03855 [Falsiroseomonas bella]|uniref:Uncharacterized protein n=1 Tax=Falsiroseomonas bella TaxID=2184016 RepID=A0A317FH91_9PROT|nr:hypothetical protein [Falsiroseomonas bella]PWS38430.1 hypothetical protein DFH01_03855 [Falsiroseomonas bella]
MGRDRRSAAACRRLGGAVLVLAAVSLAGCTQPDPVTSAGADLARVRAGLPAAPLPLRAGLHESPSIAGASPATAGNVAAIALGLPAGGVLYGMVGLCQGVSDPLGLLVCIPIGAGIGGIVGVGAAVTELAHVTTSEEPLAEAAARLRLRAAPERLGACLRDALVARSGGRMVLAADGTEGALVASFNAVGLVSEQSGQLNPSDPQLRLALSVQGELPPAAAGDPAKRRWSWRSEAHRFSDWAAPDGATFERELGLGIGLLTRRILGDVFPQDLPAGPRLSAAEQDAQRLACPPPAGAVTPPAAAP